MGSLLLSVIVIVGQQRQVIGERIGALSFPTIKAYMASQLRFTFLLEYRGIYHILPVDTTGCESDTAKQGKIIRWVFKGSSQGIPV